MILYERKPNKLQQQEYNQAKIDIHPKINIQTVDSLKVFNVIISLSTNINNIRIIKTFKIIP